MERVEKVNPFIKVSVVGAQRVGKTSLVERLCSKPFPSDESYSHTDKPASRTTVIASDAHGDDGNVLPQQDQSLQVKFVECPHEADEGVKRQVLEESFITLILYDVTDRQSFEEAMMRWFPASNAFSPESFKMLVGCKVDMVSERCVDLSEMPDIPRMFFMETSAADRTNVDLLANIMHLRACHMLQRAKQILEVQDYHERVHDSDMSFQKMYGGSSNRAAVDEAQIFNDLQRVTRLGESGTTIQDILNSMPFSLKKASGLEEEDEGAREEQVEKSQVTSPLGKAIDSMVERLEAAKLQGGLSTGRSAGVGTVGDLEAISANVSNANISKPVGDLTRRYNELKKSFALCGITIDPPFPVPEEGVDDAADIFGNDVMQAQASSPVDKPPLPMHNMRDTVAAKDSPSPARPPIPGSPANVRSSPKTPDRQLLRPPQSSGLTQNLKPQSEAQDIVVVAIKLAGNREAHIRVQEGDSSLQLARDFVKREKLPDDDSTVQRLSNLIDDKIQQYVQPKVKTTRKKLREAFQSVDNYRVTRTQLIGVLKKLGIRKHTMEKMVQDYFKARDPKTAVPSLLDIKTFEEHSLGNTKVFDILPDTQRVESRVASTNSSVMSTPSQQSSKRAPSVRSTSSAGRRGKLIAELDIQLGTSGKTGKIVVRHGDDGQALVTNFCRKYPGQLTERQAQSLVVQLNRKLNP